MALLVGGCWRLLDEPMAFHGATRRQSRYGRGPSTTQRWKQRRKRKRKPPPPRPDPVSTTTEQAQSKIAQKDAPPAAIIFPVTARRPAPLIAGSRHTEPSRHLLLQRRLDRSLHYKPHRPPYPWLPSETPTSHPTTAYEKATAANERLLQKKTRYNSHSNGQRRQTH